MGIISRLWNGIKDCTVKIAKGATILGGAYLSAASGAWLYSLPGFMWGSYDLNRKVSENRKDESKGMLDGAWRYVTDVATSLSGVILGPLGYAASALNGAAYMGQGSYGIAKQGVGFGYDTYKSMVANDDSNFRSVRDNTYAEKTKPAQDPAPETPAPEPVPVG